MKYLSFLILAVCCFNMGCRRPITESIFANVWAVDSLFVFNEDEAVCEWLIDEGYYEEYRIINLLAIAYRNAYMPDTCAPYIYYQISQYMGMKCIDEPEGEEGYRRMQEVLRYIVSRSNDDTSQYGMNLSCMLECAEEYYLACHYYYLISEFPGAGALRKVLETEIPVYNIFAETEYHVFDKIHMGTDRYSAKPMEEYGFISNSLGEYRHRLASSYLVLVDKNYHLEAESDIPDRLIYEEYGRLKAFAEADTSHMDISYPTEEKIATIDNCIEAWDNYMTLRKQLSKEIPGKYRRHFNTITNRIRRVHLANLRNRYEGYYYEEEVSITEAQRVWEHAKTNYTPLSFHNKKG